MKISSVILQVCVVSLFLTSKKKGGKKKEIKKTKIT